MGKCGPRKTGALPLPPWGQGLPTSPSPTQAVPRLSLVRAQWLTAKELLQYHIALANFLAVDPLYGEDALGGAQVVWQEVLLAFPGALSLEPLPIDWDLLCRIVQAGKRLSIKQMADQPEWSMAQPPSQLYLTPRPKMP